MILNIVVLCENHEFALSGGIAYDSCHLQKKTVFCCCCCFGKDGVNSEMGSVGLILEMG